MAPHVDILDERESLRKSFCGSMALHAAIAGAMVAYGFLGNRARVQWGTPNALGGGSVAVTVVKGQIPLPSRSGLVNPLANDTESSVPSPPPKPKPVERAREPEPDAIPIKGRDKKKTPAREAASRNPYQVPGSDRANQLRSSSGQALTSPLLGMTGSGGIGVGSGSTLGTQFGYYVDLLRQRVGEKWRTGDIDPRVPKAPPVVVTFTIRRDGSVTDVRITQRSGNAVLDTSAQRAIYDASPLPPLPAGFSGSSATVDFWFHLSR